MYGLNIYQSGGKLAYSSSDVTWNQVAAFRVGGGESVTHHYPAIGGMEVMTLQFLINDPPPDRAAYSHTVTVTVTGSEGVVSVGGGSEESYILVLAR